jgi:predicted glycoside hydrolase/deacetylase ChbG (UPF0249 family)
MQRALTIVADDYGMGPATSRGILELACLRIITGSVMIVNTPFAAAAAAEWIDTAPEADLGWHPNLTLDSPVSPAEHVPTLVRKDGSFWPLSLFLGKLSLGLINMAEVYRELKAQYDRFQELMGYVPRVVNSHQHVTIFPNIDAVLFEVLKDQNPRPYIRRVVEHGTSLMRVPGARVKRAVLASFGRRVARRASSIGYPGCDWIAGVTDPAHVNDDEFWVRWFEHVGPDGSLEICCHPGFRDETLLNRDCAEDGLVRRTREHLLLKAPSFRDAFTQAGFQPVRPSAMAA